MQSFPAAQKQKIEQRCGHTSLQYFFHVSRISYKRSGDEKAPRKFIAEILCMFLTFACIYTKKLTICELHWCNENDWEHDDEQKVSVGVNLMEEYVGLGAADVNIVEM